MRNIKVIENLPFKVNDFQDITDKLIRNDSGKWEPDRTIDQITHISIHHSAVEDGTIESYARHHVVTNKWRSIGYHLVIKGDQVFQVNDLLTFSYHTASNNAYTIGISVSADLSKRPLSEVERSNLYAAILTVMDLFKIPVENVWGHNEYPLNNTSCPCIDMNKLREDIQTIVMKMKQVEAWSERVKKCGRINSQINYMDTLIAKGESDGSGIWALQQKEKVYKIMDSQKLL